MSMSLTDTAASIAATTLATLATGMVTAATYSTDVPTATSTAAPEFDPGHNGDPRIHHRPADSRRGVIVGVISFILPFTTAVVLLRFYTRHYLSRAVGADDWMMLMSLVLAIVDGVIMLLMTTEGLGQHVWTLTSEQVKTYNMYFYLSIVFYYSCLGTVKAAILLQYLRVFAVKMRKITIAALVLIGLWSTALVFVSVLACRPIQGFWDKQVQASCVPDLPQWYVNAAGNIATDVIIFTLPIPVLWHLNLPRSQRLSLIGIFCLGFFTCTISVIRITFLNLNGDDTYANVAAACWSIGELCCAIVCSCLPTLRPVFFRLLPGTLRHNHRFNNNNSGINGGDARPRTAADRQSAYLNAGSFGSPDTIGSEGYHLKLARSGGAATLPRGPLSILDHEDEDSNDDMVGSEALARRESPMALRHNTKNSGHGEGKDVAASYYNRFYHHFHSSAADPPRETNTTIADAPGNKIGLSFTTTSRLRSSSSSSRSSRHHNDGNNTNDTDSDLDRYMQWAGRDYHNQKYLLGPETKAIASAEAATASPTITAAPETLQSLPTTPSCRSLRELVSKLASPLAGPSSAATAGLYRNSRRSSRSNSPRSVGRVGGGSSGRDVHYNSSTETLARAAKTSGQAKGTVSGASFYMSADEDSSSSKIKGGAADASEAHFKKTTATAIVSSPLSSPLSSASSSATPTRTHSPSPSHSPSPPRSYSYSHLKRMAAAVGAGVGAAVSAGISVGSGSGNGTGAGNGSAVDKPERKNSGPPEALVAPVISPITPLSPGDPLAADRDAYLGLRQGTVTSIEANRPSTAEAEAIGWELPTGPGIQIRREVAQNIGPA